MCGICGKINFNRQPIQDTQLSGMCRSFSYRGPDDDGFYISRACGNGGKHQPAVGLGHQRLSIIDLTDAGRQPMSNEDGTIWITYNGEIYNYRELADELKKKGHQFKSVPINTFMLSRVWKSRDTRHGVYEKCLWGIPSRPAAEVITTPGRHTPPLILTVDLRVLPNMSLKVIISPPLGTL